MKKNAIKGALFSVATLAAFSASANTLSPGIHLIEDLPLEQRAAVHETIVKYLNEDPNADLENNVVAVDQNGTIYVLDKNLSKICALGQPSCVGMR